MFAPDELIAPLKAGGVDYVLIGGLAVAAHGCPRATKDIDIVPDPEPGHLPRLSHVLRRIYARHFAAGDFDPAESPFDPLDPSDLRAGGNRDLATRLGRLY